MDFEHFTTKMQEAISKASQLALTDKNQVVDIEHLLYVLLNDGSGIFPRVLSKLGKETHTFITYLESRLKQKPKLDHVDMNSMRMSYGLNDLLSKAEAEYAVRIIANTLTFLDKCEKSKIKKVQTLPWDGGVLYIAPDEELSF